MPASNATYTLRVQGDLVLETDDFLELSERYENALLSVVLVDASSGIVKALRQVSLSPSFSRRLHELIGAQMRSEYEPGQHDADIRQAYAKYPSAPAMVKAADARCVGGS